MYLALLNKHRIYQNQQKHLSHDIFMSFGKGIASGICFVTKVEKRENISYERKEEKTNKMISKT